VEDVAVVADLDVLGAGDDGDAVVDGVVKGAAVLVQIVAGVVPVHGGRWRGKWRGWWRSGWRGW